MNPQLRVVLFFLAAALLLGTGRIAIRSSTAHLRIVRTWTRVQGTLFDVSSRGVTVRIGSDPDAPRVTAAADNTIGLSSLGPVTVYADPARPDCYALGGFLQLWLWPATLFLIAGVSGVCAVAVLAAGRGAPAQPDLSVPGWHFSPPPPFPLSEVVVRPPASEVRGPLVWSLIGIAGLAIGLFAPLAPLSRVTPLLASGAFLLLTGMLSLYNFTLRVSAGDTGILATSALGWRHVPWDRIKRVERRELTSTLHGSRFRTHGRTASNWGSTTESIVFADAAGHSLLRVSTRLQPRDQMRRLMEVCQAHTGLVEQFRRIDVPAL